MIEPTERFEGWAAGYERINDGRDEYRERWLLAVVFAAHGIIAIAVILADKMFGS